MLVLSHLGVFLEENKIFSLIEFGTRVIDNSVCLLKFYGDLFAKVCKYFFYEAIVEKIHNTPSPHYAPGISPVDGWREGQIHN